MRSFTTILAVLGALVMAASGLLKVLSADQRAEQSELYEIAGSDFPAWFFLLVGLFELVLVVVLVLPRTRVLGGLGLLLTMAGALLFNLVLASDTTTGTDPAAFVPVNVAIGILGLLIALLWKWVKRSDTKTVAAQAKAAATAT